MKQIILSIAIIFALFAFTDCIAQEQEYPEMLYRDGWEQLKVKEVEKIMEQPVININTGEPFQLKMEQSEHGNVQYASTPKEYFGLTKEGYYFPGILPMIL